ncbi:FtsW/RodA/SpoVE family cell cycle protein [Lysinibacillus pakistanensis]|uniref:FtsW/RodA/SpoVE family cell cycle protein n=1 Tax=Lysinibacillus pakistanensis TaxID=759811 RepID=UPI003D2C2D53
MELHSSLLLLFFLIYRIVLVTVEAKDLFMTLMGAGIASLLAFQITQNIGMTIGLLPVTGMTLPFLKLWRKLTPIKFHANGYCNDYL